MSASSVVQLDVLEPDVFRVLELRLIQRTLRVPVPTSPTVASLQVETIKLIHQLDVALLSVGFKLASELYDALVQLDAASVSLRASTILAATRELAGDHVQYNTYFHEFPRNVPDTFEFWSECVRDALSDPDTQGLIAAQLSFGRLSLLSLPKYGTYQHSYEEVQVAHQELVRSLQDRITVLHLGDSLEDELQGLFEQLVRSTTPLSESDLALLRDLSVGVCSADSLTAQDVPIRESRAVVSAGRLRQELPALEADTLTDVLRLACELSGGDVSLSTPTRFRSFSRRERRALLTALNSLIKAGLYHLGDVRPRREQWKRLGERLHPHEFSQFTYAWLVFDNAHGDIVVYSRAARVEQAFAHGNVNLAVALLEQAPGTLFRSLDRLLRSANSSVDDNVIVAAVERTASQVSGRVLCAVVEHLRNRTSLDIARVFVNQHSRAWVTPDDRRQLDTESVSRVTEAINGELRRRLPDVECLVIDPAVLGVAMPKSGKGMDAGLAVLPRGSITPVRGDHLRFFIHWRQRQQRTDFDLSALLLNASYGLDGHLSWTALRGVGAVHSGDIVDAEDGASEFIDFDLRRVQSNFIIPQVNVYSGEDFSEVAESIFGYMELDGTQEGMPFEPRTVRMRSELRGKGRVALPLAFVRDKSGHWSARWMNLMMAGSYGLTNWPNMVETNRVSTALLTRSIIERDHLSVAHLLELWRPRAAQVLAYAPGVSLPGPVTFVGTERPEGLPEGSTFITPTKLADLVSSR